MHEQLPPRRTLRYWLIGRRPSRTLWRTLGWAVVLYLALGVAWRIVWVDGESMAPTIRNHTLRLSNQLRYQYVEPQRSDIVTISQSDSWGVSFRRTLNLPNREPALLKRILALPGEEVRFEEGVFYVNGAPLEEPYVKYQGRWTTGSHRLGPDEYYVAGDNRSGTYRDHATYIVERRFIRGRLLW